MVNSPEDTSLHFTPLPSVGEGGFLSHRPMSAGIDSITQGFRFAAPGRKLPVAGAAGGGVQIVKSAIHSRERIDAETNGLEAFKLPIPISPPSPPPPLQRPPVRTLIIPEEILPPLASLCSDDGSRNTSIAKEKRKRIDNISSSDHGTMLARFEGPGVKDRSIRHGGRCVESLSSGVHEDQRPKKRHSRQTGSQKSRTAPNPNVPPRGNSGTEIIILDDDVKVERIEGNSLVATSNGSILGDSNNFETGTPAQISESHHMRGTSHAYVDQSAKYNALQSKGSKRRIGARPDLPGDRAATSSSYPEAGHWQFNTQDPERNSQSVDNDSVSRKAASKNDSYLVEPQSRHLTAMASSVTSTPQEEQGHSNTGEHRLLAALTILTTEKQALERKLHGMTVLLKTQSFKAETLEKRNSELEAQVQISKDNFSGLKKKMVGFQKFVDGLGKDYNMLNEKNSQLNNRLDEVSRDRDELFRNLQEVKCFAAKVCGTAREWGSSGTMIKEARREIEKLNETLKFLHSQLSENAGLLAAERDRTQTLECQIQEDRERSSVIITTIRDGKLELAERLTELQKAFEVNIGLGFKDEITKFQTAVGIKVEADGEVTRTLLGDFLKITESLRDMGVNSTECLVGAEKRINDKSDNILALFHETHKMNAEALTFTDCYIGHLNSRIKELELELKEIREKSELLQIVSAEKIKFELQLQAAMDKCKEMGTQVEKGKITETLLNESIFSLQHKLSNIDTEDLTVPEAMKQKNHELKKECELARDSVQETMASLQAKDMELANLRAEVENLFAKNKEAGERIERFEKEKAEFMARTEDQMIKERISVETNANIFRQRETSRLNNQIKALEAQKERLELENKEFRIRIAEDNNRTLELKGEIMESQTKCMMMEKAHSEILQGKARLEDLVKYSDEQLSGALKHIDALQRERDLIAQEMYNKQELDRAASENHELRTTIGDTTALRTAERQLREDLEVAEIEKGRMRKEKEDALHKYEELEKATNELEVKCEKLSSTNRELEGRSSNTMTGNGWLEATGKNIETCKRMQDGTTTMHDRISQAMSLGKYSTENPATKDWDDDSRSRSRFTSPELILETQFDESEVWGNFTRIDNANFRRCLFGDDIVSIDDLASDVLGGPNQVESQAGELFPDARSGVSHIKRISKDTQGSQSRKNMATKSTARRRTPSMTLDIIDDAAAVIENFSDDDVAGLSVSLPWNYPEQTQFMPLNPKVPAVEERDNKNRKRTEGISIDRNSFAPVISSNKPKTPQKNSESRGGSTDDGRKLQSRPRKDRSKKNKEEEWPEEEGEPPRNKGKDETPNTKKSLRSYKEKKKSGKRFIL